MKLMKLDRIYLEGYKSIEKLDLSLSSLNVLIGANGSGKSDFISLFRLLNEMVLGNFERYVRKTGGSKVYLHHGEKETSQILLRLQFGIESYEVCWEPTVEGQLIFSDEKYALTGVGRSFGHTYLGSIEKTSRADLESGLLNVEEKKLMDHYIKGSIKLHLLNWKVYHFHDTSDTAKIKDSGGINVNEYLARDGSNLAAFLYGLKNTHPQAYEKIRDTVRLVAPFFDDFHLRPATDIQSGEEIRLEWRQRGSDYPYQAYQLSDGTLRFMCLATVLLQPNPPATILIDEPELGLHPYAISILGALMRAASINTQLIVSTQSVELVNQFEPEDLLIVDREQQETLIRRLKKKEVSEWLEDYSLGDLWKKNIFGGV